MTIKILLLFYIFVQLIYSYNQKKSVNIVLNLKNLGTRILTGAIFVGILLFGILWNQYSFLIVFSLISVWALYEFYSLANKEGKVSLSRILNTAGGFLLFAGAYLHFSSLCSSLIVFVPYIIYILTLFISELFLKRENPILSLAHAALGQIYVALPLSLLNYLAFRYEIGGYHFALLLGLFIFIWVNDSFAYLSGSMFGKHRMFERISPKKSWEGFIGGVIFTIVVAVIYSNYFTQFSYPVWIGFALVMIIFGTLGDLIESLFKRTLNVKDSGSLLPGHGGILDRIDSVIFAIPAQFVYLEILSYFDIK